MNLVLTTHNSIALIKDIKTDLFTNGNIDFDLQYDGATYEFMNDDGLSIEGRIDMRALRRISDEKNRYSFHDTGGMFSLIFDVPTNTIAIHDRDVVIDVLTLDIGVIQKAIDDFMITGTLEDTLEYYAYERRKYNYRSADLV